MAYNFNQLKIELKKVEEWLSKEYSQVHTGRASPSLLDGVLVESFGAHMPIKNVASISIEDAKTLRVSPWDKNQIKSIEKAIQVANLGMSVAVDDQGLRIIFPSLTTENRIALVKILKERLEIGRVSARKERDKIWNDIQSKEKSGQLTEDDKFQAKNDLQKVTDEMNRNLEAIFEKKEKEVMS